MIVRHLTLNGWQKLEFNAKMDDFKINVKLYYLFCRSKTKRTSSLIRKTPTAEKTTKIPNSVHQPTDLWAGETFPVSEIPHPSRQGWNRAKSRTIKCSSDHMVSKSQGQVETRPRGIEKWRYCNTNSENFFHKGRWWVRKVILYGSRSRCVAIGRWRRLWALTSKSAEDFRKWGRKCFGKGRLFGYWHGDTFTLMWRHKLCS